MFSLRGILISGLLVTLLGGQPSPEAYHRQAAELWEQSRDTSMNRTKRLELVDRGLAAEDIALAIKPDYLDAILYKNFLLRTQASLVSDNARARLLVEQADALRAKALKLERAERNQRTVADSMSSPPPSAAFRAAVTRLNPVRVGSVVGTRHIHPPTRIHDVEPVFPPEVRASRIDGLVIVEGIINKDGSVANVRVLRGVPGLDQAAIAAVKQWRFVPTLVDGAPRSVVMTMVVKFELK
jgi:TonB family protein